MQTADSILSCKPDSCIESLSDGLIKVLEKYKKTENNSINFDSVEIDEFKFTTIDSKAFDNSLE